MADLAAVLFDWAGTMIDFGSRAPVRAMESVFAAAGVPADEALIRRYMGMAKREHVEAILREPAMAAQWTTAKGADWTATDVDTLMDALEPAMREAAAQHSTLIPGAANAASALRLKGVKVGSTTGYTRTMMADIVPAAAEQGYAPDVIICAGDTALGRPAPTMLWAAMTALEAWPAALCVAVDDAAVGIEAGRNAGLWTIGVAASGNGVGLDHPAWVALSADEQATRMGPVISAFEAAGADFIVSSVAELALAIGAIEEAIDLGRSPASAPSRFLK